MTVLDVLAIESGASYLFDRGSTNFGCLYRFSEGEALFVIRGKQGLVCRRICSRPVNRTTGLQSDQATVFCGPKTATRYPVPLQQITYINPQTGQRVAFLTNIVTPAGVADYPALRLALAGPAVLRLVPATPVDQTIHDAPVNAVKTSVRIAVGISVLVAILKKKLHLHRHLFGILQVLSVTVFAVMAIHQAPSHIDVPDEPDHASNQLSFLDLWPDTRGLSV